MGTSGGVHVAVYRIKNLANPARKFKVETNAKQLYMTGCVVLYEDVNVVVVEGGPKQQKKYKQLMLNRIKWEEDVIKEKRQKDKKTKRQKDKKTKRQKDKKTKRQKYKKTKRQKDKKTKGQKDKKTNAKKDKKTKRQKSKKPKRQKAKKTKRQKD